MTELRGRDSYVCWEDGGNIPGSSYSRDSHVVRENMSVFLWVSLPKVVEELG